MAHFASSKRTGFASLRWAFWCFVALLFLSAGGFYKLSHDLRLSRVPNAKTKAASK
jgi:hypothetical protein